jgi:hypothetical protein
MPRTLSDTTVTRVQQAVTNGPFYLVYIGLTTPVYYSTGPQCTFDSHTWAKKDIRINNLDINKATGSIQVENSDFAFGKLVADEDGISDIAIKIYEYYLSQPISSTETLTADNIELMFDGVGDDDSLNSSWVTIRLAPAKTKASNHPFIRCTKETGFNHLPPPGATISYEGNKLFLSVEKN